MTTLRCPICDRLHSAEESPAPPFCSERCQQIDLGRWLDEGYGMPHESSDDPDEDEPE